MWNKPIECLRSINLKHQFYNMFLIKKKLVQLFGTLYFITTATRKILAVNPNKSYKPQLDKSTLMPYYQSQ